MKSRVVKTILSIFTFLLIILAIILTSRPVFDEVTRQLSGYKDHYIELLKNNIGLGVKYKSLSPSILSGININNIEIYDIESGEHLAVIDKITLKYNLKNVIKKDFDRSFSKLILNNVELNYTDGQEFASFNEKIRILTGYYEKEKKVKEELISQKSIENIKSYIFLLPFNVQINDLRGFVSLKKSEYTINIKNLSLKKNSDNSNISIVSKGYAVMTFGFLKGRTIGFCYSLSGKILSELNGTSLIAGLSNYKDCDFTLTSTEVLFRYADMNIMALSNTLKTNYKIYASLALDTGLLDVNFNADHILPPSLVVVRNFNDLFYKAFDSVFTGEVSYEMSFLTKEYQWDVSGNIDISRSLLSSGESLYLNVNGTKEVINIVSAQADGSLLGGTLYGSYEIKTKEPSAVLMIDHFTLPTNGNKVSFDLYVDPYKNGIMGFIPELYLNEQIFTGLELILDKKGKTIDFSFEMNDFSHQDYETPGSVVVEGSYLSGKEPYIETSVNIDSLFLDSVVKVLSFALDSKDKKTFAKLIPSMESFITSDEIYISSDLKSFAFNFPYGIIANTQKDRQILVLSLDGTDQSVYISQLSLLYNMFTVTASLDADYSLKEKQAVFNTQCIVNSIPYNFSGNFTDFRYLYLTGDYGTEITADFGKSIQASVMIEAFPFMIKNYLLSFSTDIDLHYTKATGDLQFNINRFSAEEVSGNLSLMPKITFTGNATSEGFVISSISYSDIASVLEGTGYLLWQRSDGFIDSFNLSLNANSILTKETFDLAIDMNNPLKKGLNIKNLTTDWILSAELNVREFPMARFLSNQTDDDTINALVTAMGTIDNPYISVNIDSVSAQIASLPLTVKGNAELIEGVVELKKIYANWNNAVILDNVNANIDLGSFSGKADTDLEINFLKKQIKTPLTITLDSIVQDDSEGMWKGLTSISIPEEYTVTFDAEEMEGSLVRDKIHLHAMISKIPGAYMLSTDEVLGTYGFYLSDGSVNLTIDESKPLHVNVNGQISGKNLNLDLKNIYLDASYFSYLINSSYFIIDKGVINGEVEIGGLINDPSFKGGIIFSDYDFNSPMFVPEHFTGDDIVLSLGDDEFKINETNILIKKSSMLLYGSVYMDRWKIDRINAYLKSTSEKGIPINAKIPKISVNGNAGFDIAASYYDRTIDVTGSLFVNNTDIIALDNLKSSSKSSGDSSASKSKFDIRMDLDLILEQKVRVVLKPVFSGIIDPSTPIKFIMDTSSGMWSANGDVELRGGEITYLSRNFYIKEGKVTVDENQNSINPLINLRAETREKDSDGKSVTIILSAKNQYLENFRPVLTSTPAKSESEIMSLLGQVLTGDSDSIGNFLVAGVDYAAQLTVLQNLNNALRDLMNFDIFSLRSTVIQSAIKQGLNMNENNSNTFTLSNLFDNTTVYIGKYFGSSVYGDAQLQWVYDENADNIWGANGALQFQPELGLELEAPFANIRWSFAPDLGALQNSWATSNSITLSWSYTF